MTIPQPIEADELPPGRPPAGKAPLPRRVARRARRTLQSIRDAAASKLLKSGFITSDLAARAVCDRLRSDPEWTAPGSNIPLATLMERRLRTMEDPGGANRWLHYRWVSIFDETFRDLREAGTTLPDNFAYLEIGPGTRNSLAIATLVFMAGAGLIYSVEPDPIKSEDDWRITWGLQEIVIRLFTGNIRSEHFQRHPSQLSGILNLDALLVHEESASIIKAPRLSFLHTTLEEAPIPSGSIDFIRTRSVLEHLMDYETCFDKMATVLRPGGVMYHDIGLGAHSWDDTFAFYYRPRPDRGELNELRLSDFRRQFESRGFRPLLERPTYEKQYELKRGHLQERWRNYRDEDLLCSRAVMIMKKES